MRNDVLRDWAESQRREKEARLAKARALLERAKHRAIVDANLLTGQPLWDHYLDAVEELQGKDREELARLDEIDLQSEYMGPDETAENRFQRAILRERIKARDECLRLPKKLAELDSKPSV